MRVLLALIVLLALGAVAYVLFSAARTSVGRRRDDGRLKRERNAALEGLHNVRDIVIPYASMSGEAALLAEMVLSEIRKADDKLRKELA